MIRIPSITARSCIRYKSTFKPEELERVKLTQRYDDDSTKTKKVPMFSGQGGIEGLLYVYNRFQKVAEFLSFDTGEELFEHWDSCLSSNAEIQWDNLSSSIPVADRTRDRFEQAINEYKLKYCDENARDTMVDYMQNNKECEKTHDEDVRKHGERLRAMFEYANQLPGTGSLLTANDKKNILLNSFPDDWILNYQSNRHDYVQICWRT